MQLSFFINLYWEVQQVFGHVILKKFRSWVVFVQLLIATEKHLPLILLHLLLRLLVSFVTLFYIFHHLFSCIKSLKFNFCSYWKWGGGSIWAVWETKQFSSWWWSYREGILSYSCYWISLLFLVWLRKVKLELLMQIISLYICTGWVPPGIIQGSWPKKPVCR